MKAVAVGVDIVEYKRIESVQHLGRFAELFLTEHEREQLDARVDKIEFIASRFAAKEAVIKAFPGTITAHDFEIRKKTSRPFVHFFNPEHRTLTTLVSIAHSSEYAVGYAQTYSQ